MMERLITTSNAPHMTSDRSRTTLDIQTLTLI